MALIPKGEFMIGLSEEEVADLKADRSFEQFLRPDDDYSEARPQQKVEINHVFAVGRTHVTRKEFAAFVKATDYQIKDGCNHVGERFDKFVETSSWRSPGFEPYGDDHPVVCVSLLDAVAYTRWLWSMTNGKYYRLLTEAEYEYVMRGRAQIDTRSRYYFWKDVVARPRYFFGDDQKELCQYANVAEESFKTKFPAKKAAPCDDGYVYTAPVASFKPNAFGVYDVHGNVWSWTQDFWHGSYKNASEGFKVGGKWGVQGSRFTDQVRRGGSWVNAAPLAADRDSQLRTYRDVMTGFRVARQLWLHK